MRFLNWIKDFFKEDRKEKPEIIARERIDVQIPIERIDSHNTIPIPFESYYPDAAVKTNGMKTQGLYPQGYPEGAVIHYHAGRFDDPIGLINYGRKKNYCFFVIDRRGEVYQDFPLDRWGYHAGKSQWKKIKGTVHNKFVGIEIMAAGVLTKNKNGEFKTYWGETIPPKDVHEIKVKTENQMPGYYHKFSDDQEVALVDLLNWLEMNGRPTFKFWNIVGHDECCIPQGRKTDPGGALSTTMPYFRKLLYDFKPPHKG